VCGCTQPAKNYLSGCRNDCTQLLSHFDLFLCKLLIEMCLIHFTCLFLSEYQRDINGMFVLWWSRWNRQNIDLQETGGRHDQVIRHFPYCCFINPFCINPIIEMFKILHCHEILRTIPSFVFKEDTMYNFLNKSVCCIRCTKIKVKSMLELCMHLQI
jgi:hypothetical protein